MKKFKFLTYIFVFILTISMITGCSKYEYNYESDTIQFQFDKSILGYIENEEQTDVIVKTIDPYYDCFVEVSFLTANYGEYADILDYTKIVYTYNLDTKIYDEVKTTSLVETPYGTCQQTEYCYSYLDNGVEIKVESKAINLNETTNFVVIKRINQSITNEKLNAALDVVYQSAQPIKQ